MSIKLTLVIRTKLAAAILGGGLFGESVLPAQYCPCGPLSSRNLVRTAVSARRHTIVNILLSISVWQSITVIYRLQYTQHNCVLQHGGPLIHTIDRVELSDVTVLYVYSKIELMSWIYIRAVTSLNLTLIYGSNSGRHVTGHCCLFTVCRVSWLRSTVVERRYFAGELPCPALDLQLSGDYFG